MLNLKNVCYGRPSIAFAELLFLQLIVTNVISFKL